MLNIPRYDPKEKFEFGVLTSLAHPIKGSAGVRRQLIACFLFNLYPSKTMLGDSAIVHPEDLYKVRSLTCVFTFRLSSTRALAPAQKVCNASVRGGRGG